MCHWDKELLKRLSREDIIILLYKRYQDDINALIDPSRVIIEEEGSLARDQVIMAQLKAIIGQIDPSIKVTTDCSSNHEDERLPILDVKVWVDDLEEGESKLLHSHYMKPVSSRMLMHENSSHSLRMKRNVMINEIDRIFRNCSLHLTWEDDIVPSVSYFMKHMFFSGYS